MKHFVPVAPILISQPSEVEQIEVRKKLEPAYSILPVADELTKSVLASGNLTPDQIQHINGTSLLYTMSIHVWIAIILRQDDWKEALKFTMGGESKDYFQGLELMAENWQSLWELVHCTFPYFPPRDSLISMPRLTNLSNWNEECLFQEIFGMRMWVSISECFSSCLTITRRDTVNELKKILDSHILELPEEKKFDYSEILKGKKKNNNPYLSLVIDIAYKNSDLREPLKQYLDTCNDSLELVEKINKRTRPTKTDGVIPSYQWYKGQRKYGTQKGGTYIAP